MKTKTTAIIIPEQVQKTQPKPSKAQIIEALVEREKLRVTKVNEPRRKKIKELYEKVHALILELAIKVPTKSWTTHVHDHYSDAKRCVKIYVGSEEVESLIRQANSMPLEHFHEDNFKAFLREALKTPNPLLNNPDVEAALDNLLASLTKRPPAIEA